MGAPKTDVSIAKNYLQQDKIKALNRIVTAYLEFAELQAFNRKPLSMVDWIGMLDDFLKLPDRDILTARRGGGEGQMSSAREMIRAASVPDRSVPDRQTRNPQRSALLARAVEFSPACGSIAVRP